MYVITFEFLLCSEKNCLSNHLICPLDNNKDLETKYLNDLFSNFNFKKITGPHNRQNVTYISNKLVAYVRIFELCNEICVSIS